MMPFDFRVHHGQITSNQVLLPVIDRLRTSSLSQVTQLRVRHLLQRALKWESKRTFLREGSIHCDVNYFTILHTKRDVAMEKSLS